MHFICGIEIESFEFSTGGIFCVVLILLELQKHKRTHLVADKNHVEDCLVFELVFYLSRLFCILDTFVFKHVVQFDLAALVSFDLI